MGEESQAELLTFDDDLLGAEDVGENLGAGVEPEVKTEGETTATETPVAPDPEWKQAGFSSEVDYHKAVAREREAELKSYREDKNIQAYKAAQEQERQRQAQAEYNRQQARLSAQQKEDTEWQKLLDAHGIPPEHQGLFHGMRQLQEARLEAIERQRLADMEALYGLTEQRVAQVEQPITAALLERDFLASYPPEMHVFKADALEDVRLAQRAGATLEQAKQYAAERIEQRKALYGIKPTAGVKPALRAVKAPGMESMDAGGTSSDEMTDAQEIAAIRADWRRILGTK